MVHLTATPPPYICTVQLHIVLQHDMHALSQIHPHWNWNSNLNTKLRLEFQVKYGFKLDF